MTAAAGSTVTSANSSPVVGSQNAHEQPVSAAHRAIHVLRKAFGA
jgi:hypothetical protein